MSYKNKLKDFRWRLRRSQILIRDDYTCLKCGKKSIHNSVHHVCYEKDLEPWEYSDEYLLTLCQICHNKEHNDNTDIEQALKDMKLSGLFCSEIKKLLQIDKKMLNNKNNYKPKL